MQDSVTVTLSAPVKYGEGAETRETDQVEIRCPSFSDSKDRKYYRHLKTLLSRAILEMPGDRAEAQGNDVETSQEDAKASPKELILLLMSATGDQYHDEVEAFIGRAERCCFLDGTDPLKSGPANRLSPDDQEQLFGSYLANFILPGLLTLMSGKD